ncbi:MAG: ATP-binding cassette domain-containing protein, partial [Actinobacteria bacterium]|nr:ATP-binding cassette domain-containing protein [Actinomycetota bacterium]
MTAPANILEVENLQIVARIAGRDYIAIDNVSFNVAQGHARGLVGESGSGKSLTLRAIMGLLPSNVRVTSGSIKFQGIDLLADKGKYRKSVLGTGISMVFQEPSVALNPVMKIGKQITDSLVEHSDLNRRQARERAIDLMDQVGIRDPEKRVDDFPFQLSGGMKQRVMIAAAIACGPELILCDEPTTALDVTIQAQIIDLFKKLRSELKVSLLYVTHDIGVVAELCDAISVMYSGRIVEQVDDINKVFSNPQHPYTKALLSAIPRIDGPIQRLKGLENTAPSLTQRSQELAPPMTLVEPGWEIA